MPRIEDHIQQAMQEGKFDNLPGKGRPLHLEDDPHEDPDWQLAHHILHSSGFTLPWIAARQEIQAEIEAARQTLRRAWAWRQSSWPNEPHQQVEAEWGRAAAAFGEQVERVNKRIFDYNLQAPSERFQLRPLKVAQEVEDAMRDVEG